MDDDLERTSSAVLNKIQISVVELNKDTENIVAALETLGIAFEKHRVEENQVLREHQQILASHSLDLLEVKSNCRVPSRWNALWTRVDKLEKWVDLRTGESKWIDRLTAMVIGVVSSLTILMATFFMKGGRIT